MTNTALPAQQLPARLIEALKVLYAEPDARASARYLVAMVRELVPAVDTVALHVLVPATRQWLTLGVYGYQHYGGTLITDENDHFGRLLATTESRWARTPGEVGRIYDAADDGSVSYRRQLAYHERVGSSPHRSLIMVPCVLGDCRVAVLWVENTSRASAFTHRDLDRLTLAADVAALALAHARYATVFDESGLSARWDITQPDTRPLGHGDEAAHSTGRDAAEQPRSSARHAGSGDTTSGALGHAGALTSSQPEIRLSERESVVLRHVAEGLTNAQIAEALLVSVNTVRTHRRAVMSKLDARNAAGLLTRARELGLLPRAD